CPLSPTTARSTPPRVASRRRRRSSKASRSRSWSARRSPRSAPCWRWPACASGAWSNPRRWSSRHNVRGVANRDGRYAPSPTGPLHLGNLRTALLAWLFARSAGARFLVRVEDLDRGRSRAHFESAQLQDLEALGLDWDGEVVRQSARGAQYDTAIARLDSARLLYPCYCTRAEIREAASAPHGPLPEGAYPGTCRRLTAAERAERALSGRP